MKKIDTKQIEGRIKEERDFLHQERVNRSEEYKKCEFALSAARKKLFEINECISMLSALERSILDRKTKSGDSVFLDSSIQKRIKDYFPRLLD